MVVRATGVLRGRRVELDAPVAAFTDGSELQLELRPADLSLDEKRKLLRELTGSWAADPTIGPIFEEIERRRHAEGGRPVSFDDPS